jgi:hypothetical protein
VSSTDGNGGTEAAVMVKGCPSACACNVRAKGKAGARAQPLYSDRERERGGETEGQAAGGLP